MELCKCGIYEGSIEELTGKAAILAAENTAAKMPAIPVRGVSRFWSADADDGAKVLRWENVFANRNRTGEYSAEMRLFPNGDFTTRSNEVETVFRRVNPYDWDGDGIVNEIDDNPLLCDGDYFGPSNLLPEGANTNAYCSVSVVVEGCDSLVSFQGEGASNYPDPYFIARAGATNDVLILIGKTYHVSSVSPVRCVGVSDAETEVYVHDSRRFTVVRPVSIAFADEGENPILLRGGDSLDLVWPYAKRISALVQPSSLGGEFSFQSCCSIECDGTTISYLHDEYCRCRGCQASGMYLYEGFGIPCSAPVCCCASEIDDGEGTGGLQEPLEPSVSNPLFANFSLPCALYEDSYRNEERGCLYSGHATPVSLNVGVYGGDYGGQWTLTIANEGKLRQKSGTESRSGAVAPGESLSMELEYNAVSPSGAANDIVATLAFTENFTGSNTTASATLTAVKLDLEANDKTSEAAKNRHVFGVAEDVLVKTEPANVPGLSFSVSNGAFNPASRVWICPVTNSPAICTLYASASGERVYGIYTIVEPPRRIVAERAIALDFNIPTGTAGGAGMLLDLYVYPKTVSFSKLSMMEVPTETVGPSGYFTNAVFSAVWYHTTAMGAGEWKKIGIGSWNFWFSDEARMGDMLPSQNVLPWKSGTIIWDIPVAWRLAETNDRSYGNLIPVVYEQRFDFNTNGTLRVTKHGFWEERDPDNQMRGSEGQGLRI